METNLLFFPSYTILVNVRIAISIQLGSERKILDYLNEFYTPIQTMNELIFTGLGVTHPIVTCFQQLDGPEGTQRHSQLLCGI